MIWKLLIPVGITALFGWLAIRNMEWDAFASAMAQLDYSAWLIAVPALFATLYARGARWRILLLPFREIPAGRLCQYVVIGLFVNDLIPARVGEFYRAFLVNKNHGVPYPSSLAIVGLERVFDSLAMAILLIIGLAMADLHTVWSGALETAIGISALAIVILVVSAIGMPAPFRRTVSKLLHFLPSSWSEKALAAMDDFFSGLKAIQSPWILLPGIIVTILQWVIEAGFYMLMVRAFGLPATPAVGLLMVVVIAVGTLLPAVPTYIGVFQYAVITALGLFAIAPNDALAVSVILHITELAMEFVFGGWSLIQLGVPLPFSKRALPIIPKGNEDE